MDELPRQKLAELLTTHGRSLCDDPRRCEGLLRDYCGAYKREVNVLVSALKEHIATDLLSSSVSNQPREVLIARLTKRLTDNLGLAEDAASWAVESWALALGVIASIPKKTQPQDEPSQRRSAERTSQGKENSSSAKVKVVDTRVSRGWQDPPEPQRDPSLPTVTSSGHNSDTSPANAVSKDLPMIAELLLIPFRFVGVMVLLFVSVIIAISPFMLVLHVLDIEWNQLGEILQAVLGVVVILLTWGVIGLLSGGWEALKKKFGQVGDPATSPTTSPVESFTRARLSTWVISGLLLGSLAAIGGTTVFLYRGEESRPPTEFQHGVISGENRHAVSPGEMADRKGEMEDPGVTVTVPREDDEKSAEVVTRPGEEFPQEVQDIFEQLRRSNPTPGKTPVEFSTEVGTTNSQEKIIITTRPEAVLSNEEKGDPPASVER